MPRPRSNSPRESDISSVPATLWFIALLGVSIWSGYLLYGRSSPQTTYTMGEQLGHALCGLLLAAIVAGLLRWLAKAPYMRTLLIIWTIFVPLLFISVAVNNQSHRTAGLHQALEDLNTVLNNKKPDSGSSPAAATDGADSATTSPLQIAVERATQNTVVYKQRQVQRLQAQHDLHLELALQPDRLVSADGIEQSREALAKYRIMVAEHQADLKAYEDRNRSYLLDLPEPTKSGALIGFQKSRSATDEAFDRFFSVENRFIDTANQMLDVAQQALGHSRLDRAGKLILPEPMHSQMLALAKTIDTEVAEETAAQQNLHTLSAHYRTQFNSFVQQTGTPSSPAQP